MTRYHNSKRSLEIVLVAYIMTYTPRVRIQPAMTIDEGTIDGVVAILAEVFEQADREGWAK